MTRLILLRRREDDGFRRGGCLVTDDDELAEYARFVGHSRGGEQMPGFGRVHTAAGQALRMPLSTAAISLAQLEIIDDQVAHIDRMIRLLTDRLAEIPGIIPTPIPDHTTTYSCWMAGFSIDPGSFEVDAAEFARQCADAGLTGAGVAELSLC